MLFKYRGWILGGYFLFLTLMVAWLSPEFRPEGIYLMLAGAVLRLAAGLYIHDGTGKNKHNAGTLATTGVYSVSRNPLYLSNMISTVGILWFAGLPVVSLNVFLFLLIFFHHQALIFGEELFLSQKFKSEYTDYRKKVPRWLSYQSLIPKTTWYPAADVYSALKIQMPNLAKTFLLLVILVITRYASSAV